MRAVIYNGVGKIEVLDLPVPEIGPKDVLVKNMRAGLCGTDLGAYLHGGDDVGILVGNQIGHEFASEIIEVGPGVSDPRIVSGLRVWINPSNSARSGEGRSFLEITDSAGGLSQFITVQEAEIGFNLFPLPENVTWDQAALIEPLSVGNHAVNTANVQPGQKALVFGAGAVGLSVLCNLRAHGVDQVIVSDIEENRLKVVEQLGGIPVNGLQTDPIQFAMDQFGAVEDMQGNKKPDIDAYFDSSGAPNSIPDYVRGGKPGSAMVVVAIGHSSIEIPHSAFVLSELKVLGSLAYSVEDNAEVVAFLEEEKYDPTPIITHHFAQEDVAEAFETAVRDKGSAIKVVVNVHA